MSTSGLTNEYNPPTLDGLTVIEADQVYIGGQEVNVSNLVPYTGANQTVDLGTQIIRTTHTATTNPELVNFGLLNTTISNLSIAIAGSFLDKTTTTQQSVAGNVSYIAQLSADDLLVPATKTASLGGVLTIDATYRRSETDATVSTVQYFGAISSSLGIYQATSTQNFAILQVADLGVSGTGKRMDINWNLNINEASYNSSIQLFASSDGTSLNQYLGPSVSFTPSDPLYKVMTGTFVPVHRYICVLCITSKPGGVQTVRWYGLQLDEQGVELTNVTMPSLGADRVAVFNGNKQLVSSGISITKLNTLDNVSSDIQSQLNSKLNLSGSNANQDIILGGYKVQSSATPTTGNDLTNKTYVDGAITTGTATIPRKADVRTGVAPNAQPGATMSFYFGTHTNNDNAPFSDMLLLNGWTDSTAGSVNLLSFSKGAKGIRQYQGAYGSTSAFSTYYDAVMTDANTANVTLGGTLALGANKATSSATPSTDDDLCRKGYVDTQDGLRVLKAGDTMTATLYNSGGDFHPYRGGDTNRGCILTAYDADGATYASNNGGLASWFGISFKSTYDNTTRFVFNTRDGSSSQTGTMKANGVNIDGLTASRALGLDASKNVAVSTTTLAELNLLTGITSSVQNQLNAKGNLAGGNMWSDTQTFNGTVAVSNRLLGLPDSSPNGNFWMGLRGSGSEVDRLAISINGDYTTGAVAKVIIAKPLNLNQLTASRVLILDGSGVVASSSVTSTVLSYLDIGSSLSGLLNLKANLAGPQTFSGTHTFNSATPINLSGLTAERVITLDGSKNIATSAVTTTELGFLSGTVSSVQSQINGKVSKSGDVMTGTLGMNGATVIEFGQGVSGKETSAGKVGYETFTGGNLDIVGAGTSNTDRKVRIYDKLGIGITARAALDVEGSIITNWADYRIGTQFDTATSGYYLGMTTNVATRVLNLVSQSADPGGSGAVVIQTGASPTERVRWTHDGIMKFPNLVQNRVIVLYEGADNDHQYYGMGINASTFRFNINNTADKYSFFAGTSSTASTEVFRINGIGGAQTGISGVNASTTPFFKAATSADHYGGNPSEVWLFNGYNGHLGIGKNATQDANTTNLMLGVADTEESQLISLATNNLTYKPMSFAGSKHTLVGGPVNIAGASPYAVPQGYMATGSLTLGSTTNNYGGGNNWTANTAGLLMECLDNTEIAIHDSAQRVASFCYYQGGSTNTFTIGRDMGWGKTATTVSGRLECSDVVGIGLPSSNTYQAPIARFTINSSYTGGDTGCFAINAYDGGDYSLRLFPYVQAGGQVAYQFKTYNLGTPYNSLAIGYNGFVGIGTTQPVDPLHISAGDNTRMLYGPNATWGAYLRVGSGVSNISSNTCQLISTNGSLHADAGYGKDMYFNYYAQQVSVGNIYSYCGSGFWSHSGNMFVSSNVGVGTTSTSITYSPPTVGKTLNVDGYVNGLYFYTSGTMGTGSYQGYIQFVNSGHFIANINPGNAGHVLAFNSGKYTFAGLSSGTVAVDGSGYLYTYSDRRVKNSIQYLEESSLDKVLRLKPCSFKLNQDPWNTKVGFIAQDVEEVIRDAVDGKKHEWRIKMNKETGQAELDEQGNVVYDVDEITGEKIPRWRGLDTTAILAHAVKAIQEQQTQIETLSQRNIVLETWAREQEAKQKKMEERMEKMASLLSQLMAK